MWKPISILILLTFALTLGLGASAAQRDGGPRPKIVWEAAPESAESAEYDSLLARDPAGNVYVAARSVPNEYTDGNEDIVVHKYSSHGDLLWKQEFNGTGVLQDVPKDIVVDPRGAVYVTGRSFRGFTHEGGTSYDWVTLKLSATSGAMLWNAPRYYNGPSNGSDEPAALALDSRGNLLVTGYAEGPTGRPDVVGSNFVTLKYDPDGNLLWERTYSGPSRLGGGAPFGVDDLAARDVVTDGANNVYVTGSIIVVRGGREERDVLTMKYAADGRRLWAARYDGPGTYDRDDDAYELALSPDGSVVVMGNNAPYDDFYMDPLVLKHDAGTGQLIWARTWGIVDLDETANEIEVDPDDGSIYLGVEAYRDSGAHGGVVKLDARGRFEWERLYEAPGSSFNGNTRIALDRAGSVYAAVLTQAEVHLGDYVSDVVFLKLDPKRGQPVWIQRYDGPYGMFDSLPDLITDDRHHIIAGLSTGTPSGIDLLTVKLRTSGGAPPPAADSLTVQPPAVVGGADVEGTVTLAAPAPPGGAFVQIMSSDAQAAQAELALVPVPRGQTTASFRIVTGGVAARARVELAARVEGARGPSVTTILTVRPAALTELRIDPSTVSGGSAGFGSLRLNGYAPPNGAAIRVTSSDPAVATVDSPVFIPGGWDSASFNVTTRGVSEPKVVTITATYRGVSLSQEITVTPAELSFVYANPGYTTGGEPVELFVQLNGTAAAGGATIQLRSSDPAHAAVPATATIREGEYFVTVPVTTSAVTGETNITLTAEYRGETRETTLTLVPAS